MFLGIGTMISNIQSDYADEVLEAHGLTNNTRYFRTDSDESISSFLRYLNKNYKNHQIQLHFDSNYEKKQVLVWSNHVVKSLPTETGRYFSPDDFEEKVKLALANGLTPIFCIGEVLEEREANKQNEVVAAQMESVFSLSAEDFSKIVLAYEPVWAIGTGKTASPEQAQEIHAFIRSIVADKYGKEIADNTSILYGGSCKPSNAKELFSNPDVDGGLIGGAALKVSDFKGIIDAFNA